MSASRPYQSSVSWRQRRRVELSSAGAQHELVKTQMVAKDRSHKRDPSMPTPQELAAVNGDRNLALFCDFENIALGVQDSKYADFDMQLVVQKLLLKGSIVVKKAYCDWERYKGYKKAMHEAAFELIEIPHVRQSGKNGQTYAWSLMRSTSATLKSTSTRSSSSPVIPISHRWSANFARMRKP